MSKHTRLLPGDVIACYTILKQLVEAPSRNHRRYLVQASCCGREVERAEETLSDYRRRPPICCLRCAQTAANSQKRGQCGFHERFGPVKVIDRSDKPNYWLVVWDCCGKQAELTRQYLVTLRRNHRLGQTPAAVCLTCAAKIAKQTLAERRAASKAVRVPRPKKLPLELATGLIRVKGSAVLPPGILSAALAWPRPGAGA